MWRVLVGDGSGKGSFLVKSKSEFWLSPGVDEREDNGRNEDLRDRKAEEKGKNEACFLFFPGFNSGILDGRFRFDGEQEQETARTWGPWTIVVASFQLRPIFSSNFRELFSSKERE